MKIVPISKAKIKISGIRIVNKILVFKENIFIFVNFTNMNMSSRINMYVSMLDILDYMF